jgi:hypothetical protein
MISNSLIYADDVNLLTENVNTIKKVKTLLYASTENSLEANAENVHVSLLDSKTKS